MIAALLNFIDSLPVDDPAQAMAREWARRVRELTERGDALLLKAKALFDADDLDAMDKVLVEHDAVMAELATVCRRQQEVVSRMRPSTETMQ